MLKKLTIYILILTFIISCSNNFLPQLEDVTPNENMLNESTPNVVMDEENNIALYVGADKNAVEISSFDDELERDVKCVNPSSFKVLVGDDILEAVVIGMRDDGEPGIWLIGRDRTVVSPYNEETGIRTPLLNKPSKGGQEIIGGEFKAFLGWKYYPTIISDNGKMIGGYALNEEGFSNRFISIESGEKAALYWPLYSRGDGRFFVGNAKVVAFYPEYRKSDNRFMRWMRAVVSKLKLLFLDRMENYLLEPVEVTYLEEESLYQMTGNDKANKPSIALFNKHKVYSIENINTENSEPYSVLGPSSIDVTISPASTSVNLEVDSTDGMLDPDGDMVNLNYEIISQSAGTADDIQIQFEISNGIGILSVAHPGSVLYGHWAEIEIWTEDPQGLTSPRFTVYLFYQSS